MQFNGLTFFFKDLSTINIYDVGNMKFPMKPIKLFKDNSLKVFKPIILQKSEVLNGKFFSKILIFGYKCKIKEDI